MLAVVLSWLLISLVSIVWGHAFVLLFGKATDVKNIYTITDLFFVGICVVGTLISITSLLIPSDATLMLCFVVVSLLFITSGKIRRPIQALITLSLKNISRLQFVLGCCIVFPVMLFAMVTPQLADSFYYHIQNIMWNEEYRVVPGLSNLIEQFGFNSNFFLLNSVFGLKLLFGDFIYSINALLLVILFLFFISLLRGKSLRTVLACLGLIVCFILVYIYKKELTSPSTDIFPSVVTIYLLGTILKSPDYKNKILLFILLPVFCLTIKLSSVILCLVTIYIFVVLFCEKRYSSLLSYISMCLLVLLPWLIRNVIITGYIVYPIPAVDIFSFDWKTPIDIVIESNKYIKANVYSHDIVFLGSDYILNLSYPDKVRLWISGHHLPDICFMFLATISPIVMFFACLYNRRILKESKFILYIWILAFIGFAFLLFTAPAVRFGFGFIISVIVIPIYYMIIFTPKWLSFFIQKAVLYIISAFVVLGVNIFSVRNFLGIKNKEVSYLSVLFKPQSIDYLPLKKVDTVRPIKVNNFYINVSNSNNYNYPLPTSKIYPEGIEMRGASLQDGFRVKK